MSFDGMDNGSSSLLPDPEPEDALSAFMKTFNARLEERRELESKTEQDSRGAATQEVDGWKLQKEKTFNAKKEKNRTEEQVLLESINTDAESSNVWERVSKLIDMNKEAEGKKDDIIRMKKLFIQLKNEPLDKTRE